MALEAKNKRYCMVTFHENGKQWRRRIQVLMVQAANGKLHYIRGKSLPDSITLLVGTAYTAAPKAEVFLRPRCALGIPLDIEPFLFFNRRDAFFLGFGMFLWIVLRALAEASVQSLVF